MFTQGRQLPLAGLLLAMPTLQATGLLEVAEATYGKLAHGFYAAQRAADPGAARTAARTPG